jgi:hypothetical protein
MCLEKGKELGGGGWEGAWVGAWLLCRDDWQGYCCRMTVSTFYGNGILLVSLNGYTSVSGLGLNVLRKFRP